MRFVNLTKRNYKIAWSIVKDCFPSESDRKEIEWYYKLYVNCGWKKTAYSLQYFIVYEGARAVGITGLYKMNKTGTTFWLGYFGVIKKERKKGIGTEILTKTLQMAKRRDAKRVMTWTTSKKAEYFYKIHGFKQAKHRKVEKLNGKVVKKYSARDIFYSKTL